MKLIGKIDSIIQKIIPELMKLDKEKIYELNCDVKRNKRQMNQNDKFYKLQNELADVLKISNEELHFELLKRYSPIVIATIPSENNPNGYFQYYEEYKKGITKGKEFTSYKVYLPSSQMNTKQFSRLLQGLCDECEEVGIETISPEEKKSIERSMYGSNKKQLYI